MYSDNEELLNCGFVGTVPGRALTHRLVDDKVSVSFVFQSIVGADSIVLAYEVNSRIDSCPRISDYISDLEMSGEIVDFDLRIPVLLENLLHRADALPIMSGITINVSPTTIALFPDKYIRTIRRVRKLVQSLWVEITEEGDVDIDAIEYFRAKAKKFGIGIMLDDCHHDHVYSKPYVLRRCRPDMIKLDGARFVDWYKNGDADALKETICYAKSLKIGIVAEHVETREQFSWAYEYGCRYFQGYLIGKPLSAADFFAKEAD